MTHQREMMRLLLLALIFGLVTAKARIRLGRCNIDSKTPVKPFHVNEFAGHWYNVFDYPNSLPTQASNASKCYQAFVTVDTQSVRLDEVNFLPSDEQVLTASITSSSLPLNDSGIITFSAPLKRSHSLFVMNVIVLDIDYENYAVLYMCGDIPPLYSVEDVFIWSRTPNLDDMYYTIIDEVLSSNGLQTLESMDKGVQDCGQYTCLEERNENCFYSSLPSSEITVHLNPQAYG